MLQPNTRIHTVYAAVRLPRQKVKLDVLYTNISGCEAANWRIKWGQFVDKAMHAKASSVPLALLSDRIDLEIQPQSLLSWKPAPSSSVPEDIW